VDPAASLTMIMNRKRKNAGQAEPEVVSDALPASPQPSNLSPNRRV
jgi:hypothetical protein